MEGKLLSDYKVAILVVDEDQIAREYQSELADPEAGLKIGDVGRVIGCLNGLAKRDPTHDQFASDPAPMQRAVAFSTTIKNSKHFVDLVGALQDEAGSATRGIQVEARHVDGKTGVLVRARQIAWLGEAMTFEGQCHILSNARCLTEGIDVPALDAVLFLQPRKSQIDVVQAVGRVMRRAEGKKYGYISLPVVVPAGEDPADMLDKNNAYAHVWEVLQALRSHDERFDAWVNKLDLNRDHKDDPVCVIGVGSRSEEDGDDDDPGTHQVRDEATQYVLAGMNGHIEQWREAIYAKIVLRCGTRRYWEQWADSVASIATTHLARIRGLIGGADPELAGHFAEFVEALRKNLNDSISEDAAAVMLSQHLITRPVFEALFGSSEFTRLNPVSQAMQRMVDKLEGRGLEAETEELDRFYASVRTSVQGIDNPEGRQRVAIELYDNFFRKAVPRDAERLGIRYTPVEIVDFMLRAVADLLPREFGVSLSDEGVHVLDPFTGTGTFITRLLQSEFITPDDLPRKYRDELHANEIMLLAYYIAAVNIETAYGDVLKGQSRRFDYEPFSGVVLTDTFQASEPDQRTGSDMFPRNSKRIERQLGLDIRVIVSNPPWSAGQRSANDANPNLRYPALDGNKAGADARVPSIAGTYAAEGAPGLKRGLYDSYVRAIRWASNRVLDCGGGGIVAFVTNGGFLDGKAFDGLRKTLASEFHAIYVYNLRGNARTSGETRRREGDGVFALGSRAGVAILLLIKRPGNVPDSGAQINYRDIGDYLRRDRKLQIVKESGIGDEDWVPITPNRHGDWIGQRSERFLALRPLASLRGQPAGGEPIFTLASRGVTTSRDWWVLGSSEPALRDRVAQMVEFYNEQVQAVGSGAEVNRDPSRFSWDGTIEELLARRVRLDVREPGFRTATYRPFFKQHLYLDSDLNNSVYQLPRIFPTAAARTPGIVVESKLRAPGRAPGSLAVDSVPEVAAAAGAAGQACVIIPRHLYESESTNGQSTLLRGDHSQRLDNITDSALGTYRAKCGDGVVKDQIFAYVYGVLHAPEYRERYSIDLAKMLPRIPDPADRETFFAFAEAGQRLLDLHIGYEDVEPYPLEERVALGAPEGPERYRVEKMRWAGPHREPDRSTLVYNDSITLAGIPDGAHEYVVGPRSALAWLIDRYQVKTDKASGIVNDVNDWGLEHGDPRYIVDLVKRIVTVSLETMTIVGSLPELREAE